MRVSVHGGARKRYITEDGSQSASSIDESNKGGNGGGICEEKGSRGGLTAQRVEHRVAISLVVRAC